jgi:membrane protease YdiL (CAAX protease family)
LLTSEYLEATVTTMWESRPELPEGAPPPKERPQWPVWAGLIAVPTALVVAMVGGLVVLLVGSAAGDDISDPGPASNLGATVVQDIGFVAVALGLAIMAGRALPGDFGLRRPRLWPAIGWSLLAYLAVAIVGASAAAAFGVGAEEQDDVLESLGIDEGTAYVYVAAFVVTVMAPLAEEFLFRGFVFNALRGLGLAAAALISGLIFGGIHVTSYIDESWQLAAASIVTLSSFGVILALLLWKTGSLLPCIALHAINNSIAFGVMQDWGWQIPVLIAASLATCGLAVMAAVRLWGTRSVGAPHPAR